MRTVYSRNVFLDSEINAIGNGQTTRIQFPTSTFNVNPGQYMKLVLTSFTMRRNWYNINPHNSIFYVFQPAVGYTQVEIINGTYDDFGTSVNAATPAGGHPADLVSAIFDGLNNAGFTPTEVSYNTNTRKFTIDMTGVVGFPLNAYFVAFQVKSEPKLSAVLNNANITDNGYFQDVSEILGCKKTSDNFPVDAPTNAFGTTVGQNEHVSPFVGALNSIETIFIRTGLQTNNYQTFSFERNLPNQAGLTATNIFARIPLRRSHFDPTFEIIDFEDTGAELFTILLQQTQLSDMLLTVTDHSGRPLPQVSDGQNLDGNLSFKLSFRWEIIEQESPQGEQPVQLPARKNMQIIM